MRSAWPGRGAVSLLLLLLLVLGSGESTACADGGHIALHATSGEYTITVLTAPDPLVTGRVDISLLVQDAASDAVLGDATSTITLTGQAALSPIKPIQLKLTHEAASNKLLLAGSAVLGSAGMYHLRIAVARPGRSEASFFADLHVAENHGRSTTLIVAVMLPLLIILLFLINQHAKRGAMLRRALPPSE